MLLIDRYLLRQFTQNMLIFFFSLTGLYIIIDSFNNLEEFITFAEHNRALATQETVGGGSTAAASGDQRGNLFAIMAAYYYPRAISFFDRTSGILTLIAAMFTVTWIQRHNELTALQAAGVAKFRVLRPVVVAVLAIAALAAVNRELVIPRYKYELSHNAQNLGGAEGKDLTPRYDNKTDILIRGQHLFAHQQRIHNPTFLLPATLDEYGNKLAAEDAYYKPASETLPSGYLFVKLSSLNLDRKPSLKLGDRTVVYTPLNMPGLRPGECFVASDVTFEQLEDGGSWRQYSSTFELVKGLRNPSLDFGADVRVAIHARFVQPLLDVTLLFLGLPLILAQENRNVFRAIGLCLVLVLAFMLVVIACNYLGTAYVVNPALAAWLPLMIFVPCAVGLSDPLRA
jgi:lipopolysaccharide export system permease protein